MDRVSRRSLIAEISEIESMLNVDSSADLVEDIDLDPDMGEGAVEASDFVDADFEDVDMDDDFEDVSSEDDFEEIENMEDLGMEDFEGIDEIDDFEAEMDVLDVEDGSDILDSIVSSETEPGIEDEITQDYLEEVSDEIGVDDISTEDSMIEVPETGYTARLKEASRRLDRVASYLEKSGQVKLAFRLDRLADALDSEVSRSV